MASGVVAAALSIDDQTFETAMIAVQGPDSTASSSPLPTSDWTA